MTSTRDSDSYGSPLGTIPYHLARESYSSSFLRGPQKNRPFNPGKTGTAVAAARPAPQYFLSVFTPW